MPIDRLTKSLFAVTAGSLAVLALRSAAQQPATPVASIPTVPATLQISATADGFLAYDASNGEVLRVTIKDKSTVDTLGTLRKSADGRWEFGSGKGNAGAANGGADGLKIVSAQADVAKLMVALNAFKKDAGRFPATEEGLQALVVQPTTVETWKGPYLKDGLPKDPWGNPYIYREPGKVNVDAVDVFSFGPDQRDAGGDDIFGR